MKSLSFLLIAAQLISLTSTARAPTNATQTIVVGVSSYYPPEDALRVRNALVGFVLETAPTGSTVMVQDAYRLQSIATFPIPALAARYDSPATRARELKQPLNELLVWFNRQTNSITTGVLKNSAALLVPEWCAAVQNQIGARKPVIILIGSPLRIDPREPAFNMVLDLVPSDRHLTAPPEESVFSTSAKAHTLDGCSIFWTYLSEGIWANELHAQRTRRFWSLWTSTQQSVLASFGPDLGATLALVKRGAPSPVVQFEIDPTDRKLTMRAARAREIPRWMSAPLPASSNSIPHSAAPVPVAPAANAPPPAPSPSANSFTPPGVVQPERAARPVVFALGLMWEGQTDVDLYFKTRPDTSELYFGRVLTREGRYLHDFRSGNAGHDYEWVEVWEDVDIARAEAWINLFEGTGPVCGAVCVYYQGRRYLSKFCFPAITGNRGANHERRLGTPQWFKINLAQVLAQPAQ